MPRLGVFAQGFYGYPGYNLFEDMMRRRFSWNGMVGARLTWNIGALYTQKNDKAKLNVQRSALQVQRETFLFNNRLQQQQTNGQIENLRQQVNEDEEIIQLREGIRNKSEKRVQNGIETVNEMLRDINAVGEARQQKAIHEVQLLQEIYELKTINNN
jgi:uncharacterized membrane-anchored protein YjiN (DUF445 family)